MNKKIAIQMDPIEKIDYEFDTSFLIAHEAQRRGYEIFYYNPKNLFIQNNIVKAKGNYIKLYLNEKKYFEYLSNKITLNLSDFIFVFLRQDPPFDMNYITSTYILDFLPDSTHVINNPTAVRNSTEKLYTFKFKEFMAPTIVSKDLDLIEEFLNLHKVIITKPLYGNGGIGIHKFTKESFDKEKLRSYLDLPLMVQKFIKEINLGDRRIIFIDGDYVGSVSRVPQVGEVKANFHAGGIPCKTELVFRDKQIIDKLGPELRKKNLFFVGIDVIGDYLTEINVTSPTGIKQINILNNVKLENLFWDKLEAKYKLV